MRLRLLVFENERDLSFESVPLNQVCDISLPVEEFEDEHLQKNEGGIDRREDSLDCVLLATCVLICVVLIVPDCLEDDSIRT